MLQCISLLRVSMELMHLLAQKYEIKRYDENKKEILEYSVFILETFQVGYCHKICIFGLTAEYTPSREI